MLGGQSVGDRINAAKHSITGQGLAKSVGKATTVEVMGPKKKHIDYLVHCTNEPNVSIPQLADLLIDRTKSHNWVIVFKALVSTHNLINFGNERFMQYLASSNCSFLLQNFTDRRDTQAYDMSTFIRRYSKYMNEKAIAYRAMAFDFCKIARGEDGLLRRMDSEKLLKAIPQLQRLIDTLLEFDVNPNELTNGVINACFMLLFKDLIRLFACYNDGIINLLEKFFDMNKKQARDALEIYKRFLARMERVSDFLKVAENIGIDRGNIPDLTKAPASLLEALEQHLASLEGKKVPMPSGNTNGETAAVGISDVEKKRILEEESKTLEKFKADKDKSPTKPGTSILTSPSGGAASSGAAGGAVPAAAAAPATTPSAIDDLLQLDGNPFIQNVESVMKATQQQQQQQQQQSWQQSQQPSFDAFGDLLQPTTSGPAVTPTQPPTQPVQQGIGGDLDTSLASLAGNLSLGRQPQYQQPRPVMYGYGYGMTSWGTTQPAPMTTQMGMVGMGQPMMGQPMMAPQGYMGMQQPGMQQAGMYQQPGLQQPGLQQPTMAWGAQQQSPVRQPAQQNQQQDPFGSLLG